MGRTKKVSPSPAVKTTTVLDRIRAAEKSLLTGATARVLISETDLENVASLIYDTGSTQAQILKKAVHLGLQVLKMGSPAEATTAVHEEAYEEEPYLHTNIGGWTRPDPVPYAGFELRRPSGRHDAPIDEPAAFTAEPPSTAPEEGF